MFKPKAAELPPIAKLADFPKYQRLSSDAEIKHEVLQACKDRLTALRAELSKFDVSEMNPQKHLLQKSIASEKEIELRLQKELAELDVFRQRVVTEISAEFNRQSAASVRALLERLAEAQVAVAALETTYLDYVEKIETVGLNAGHLPRPFHLLNLGRQSDTNSLIHQIQSAGGVWPAVQEVAHA